MAVTINKSRSDAAPFHTVGAALTATDASDSVGILISDADADTKTRVTIVPVGNTTPVVSASYSVLDTPTSTQFVKLGSELEVDQTEDIDVPALARVIKFGGVNAKDGGVVAVSSTARLMHTHSGESKSVTPATKTIVVAVNETESEEITPSINSRLFTWSVAITAGSSNLSVSEVYFNHDFGVAVDITRSSAGAGTVVVTGTPHDGSDAITSTFTVN